MKKTNKPEIGKLTVIKPKRKARQTHHDDRGDAGIVAEAIGAIQGAIAAGKRVADVIRKIRRK